MRHLLRSLPLLAATSYLFASALPVRAADSPAGIRATGADGAPLNLGFEDGTLKDWRAEGRAFERQPVNGDSPNRRRNDLHSQHAGGFWVGTYEFFGDDATGTLTSVPFKVTQPFASFLIGGGSTEENRVELVRADTKETLFKVNGFDREEMRRVVVDLSKVVGKDIYIRVVDHQIGGWGHINYDDFLFHAAKPEFPNQVTPAELARQSEVSESDVVSFAGLSAEDAAAKAKLPPGFKMHLFAGEPDVRQPIAFCLDHRGRVWVAEGYTYPVRAAEGQGKDRILVFEDTNGDGRFDKRTVFAENLNLVSGLEVGFGGVFVGAAPQLMFIPDRDGDLKPDGPAEVLLDGWDYRADTHETLNTFTWGPDGWLYGCHGVFCPSFVGKPGTPDKQRQRVDAAVWRYHPTKQKFEVFAEGTSNPWGVDFDERGQCFIEACVIPHLWHMIQGARYQRQGGQHYSINLTESSANAAYQAPGQWYLNPFVYDDIKTIADHFHYTGSKGPHAANGRSNAAGGGHAHAGLMVYLGDSFPEKYRGALIMNNIHGQRLNMDVVERKGSGYVGHHAPDFVNFDDRWSQVLNMLYDQDGSVYIIDWYDKNQCHHNNVNGHDRDNGRIFKLVYGDKPTTKIDLSTKSEDELVQLQLHRNDFLVRHARRVLQERAAAGQPLVQARAGLVKILNENTDETRQLRALWALHVMGAANEELLLKQLSARSEYVRAWAIQLAFEEGNPSAAVLKEVAKLAASDTSAFVRLYIAAALQRTPVASRPPVLEALLARPEDAGDHNLPLMYWYATEPVVGADSKAAVALLGKTRIPSVRQYITRRMTTKAVQKQP